MISKLENETKNTYKVGIIIFDDVEVLDFCGPYEVFSVTRFLGQSYDTEEQIPFSVETISQTGEKVNCRHGLEVIPDRSFEGISLGEYDILVVPGGLGVRKVIKNRDVLDFIKKLYREDILMTSVCTGSLLLAEAGLLEGKAATTHVSSLDKFEREYSQVQVMRNKKVVEVGNIITSAGISSGINMSLHIVKKLLGERVEKATREFMEYDG